MSEAVFKCGSKMKISKASKINLMGEKIGVKFDGAESIVFYGTDGALHPEHESPFDIANIEELVA